MATSEGSEAATAGDDPLAGDIDHTLEEALSRDLVSVAGPVASPTPVGPDSGLPRAGSLAEQGLALLLASAYRQATSGRLLVEREGHQYAVDLDCGWPVSVSSSDAEHGLLAMLVRQGRLSPEDRQHVRDQALLSGRRTGAIAVEMGLLKAAELMPALRAHQEEIVLSALTFTEGGFTFDPELRADPAQIRIHRHPLALVREGLDRAGDGTAEDLLARMGGPEARLCLVGGVAALDLLEQAATRPGDRRLLALFDGVRALGDVVRRGEMMSAASGTALAFALFAGGHLVPASEAHGKRVLRDRQLDRERILARATLVASGDYFEFLGVPPTAGLQEVERALGRLEQDLASAEADPDMHAALRTEIEEVRLVMEEAARVLGDDRLRGLYRAGREPR